MHKEKETRTIHANDPIGDLVVAIRTHGVDLAEPLRRIVLHDPADPHRCDVAVQIIPRGEADARMSALQGMVDRGERRTDPPSTTSTRMNRTTMEGYHRGDARTRAALYAISGLHPHMPRISALRLDPAVDAARRLFADSLDLVAREVRGWGYGPDGPNPMGSRLAPVIPCPSNLAAGAVAEAIASQVAARCALWEPCAITYSAEPILCVRPKAEVPQQIDTSIRPATDLITTPVDDLAAMLANRGMSAVARMYGMTENEMRKLCRRRDVPMKLAA